jgi:hypothetical protein
MELGDDRGRRGGSDERFWLGVVFREIAFDGGLKIDDRLDAAATDAASRQHREEIFHSVPP